MNASSPRLPCPHCPGSLRTFSLRGLKIHITRKHGASNDGAANPTPQTALSTDAATDFQNSGLAAAMSPHQCPLENIATLKNKIPVLRHIPKGARNQAAGKLSYIIERCVDGNNVGDWCSLLSFAYSALRVPSRKLAGNMTTKVKANIESSCFYQFDGEIDGFSEKFGSRSITKSIESKVFEGDLRGAVRLLMSNDTFAQRGPDVLDALKLKHPGPSRPLSPPPAPDTSYTAVVVTMEDVALALGSFYSGSAAGLDGIRPGHLKELTSRTAGENGRRLMESLVRLTNFLLSGQLNPEVCPYMYGAALFALAKRDGGLRPIAVGSTFRRLAAKLACRAVREEMAEYLQPQQLGFGARRGCETAIHATRAYVMDPANSNCVVLKLDIRNAFNTLERDVLLCEVKEKLPSLYPFLHQIYQSPSNLFFNKDLILSQVGAQQGDPLGPLVFSLAIHKVISELNSPLNLWYLDDGTIGGKPEVVEQDLRILVPRLRGLGLEVNPVKCEFFPCSEEARTHFGLFSTICPGLIELIPSNFNLLGSPIFLEAVPEAIISRKQILVTAQERLKDLSAHVAMLLLRMCFAVPKVTYLLRTTPTWLCPEAVSAFDSTLKETAESILNVSFNALQWSQAALPIRHGGLGLRRVCDVGLPAFLASAHGVAGLVAYILPPDGDRVRIPYMTEAVSAWLALSVGVPCPVTPHNQRAWDDVGVERTLKTIMDGATGADLARLKAVSRSESGAWLYALPSPNLGTLMDDDSLRVAVALRLGCKVCEPHRCTCGSMVEADGHHALSCRRCSGRFQRHHALNDIVRRALISANIPCVLEPPGLSRSDGKRPDGLTLVPWKHGRCLVWDATCVSTVAASHLGRTVHLPAAAAEDAANKKRAKYATMEPLYHFVPIAVETLGSWGAEAKTLMTEIGRRIREHGGDSRSGSFLVQRMAIAIQRGNAASIMGTFAPGSIRGGLFDS